MASATFFGKNKLIISGVQHHETINYEEKQTSQKEYSCTVCAQHVKGTNPDLAGLVCEPRDP